MVFGLWSNGIALCSYNHMYWNRGILVTLGISEGKCKVIAFDLK